MNQVFPALCAPIDHTHGAATRPPAPPLTILLVEDDEPVRRLCATLLRRGGYRVLQAGRASQALSLAARHCPAIHLLLADAVLPDLPGQELARRLRELRPQPRVLFMSGYPRSLATTGDAGFLAKPFSAADLISLVDRALRGLT